MLYCQQGMVGRVQLNPFQPQIEGHFYSNNSDTVVLCKTLYFLLVTNLCNMLECCWRPNVGTNIGDTCASTTQLHISHFTQKSTTFDAYLLWGSCEIGVFILPIKTILSELFRLGWALDCEWRDLKLETNFVLRNFYYLWKSSYMNIGFSTSEQVTLLQLR